MLVEGSLARASRGGAVAQALGPPRGGVCVLLPEGAGSWFPQTRSLRQGSCRQDSYRNCRAQCAMKTQVPCSKVGISRWRGQHWGIERRARAAVWIPGESVYVGDGLMSPHHHWSHQW